MKERSILTVGHRGAAGHAPENTISAIERGISLGADLVEVDVQRTRDGRFVLMHDKFVERTTNGAGKVTDHSIHELRNLDAGGGQPIPTLEEALETASGRAGIILEIITPGIGSDVYRQVNAFGYRGPLIFSSFLHADIRAIREMDSAVATMALMEGVPLGEASFAVEAGATHAGVALDSMTAEYARALHDAALRVFVYTPDTPMEIALAAELGADGIISNFPERVRATLGR